MNLQKETIGTIDIIDFPENNLFDLPCKIDTGAETSSIHCERVKIKEINGEEILYFKFLDKRFRQYTGQYFQTKNYKESRIKSSFGDYEYRYQVKLVVSLFGKKILTPFNLSNRSKMKYPVLLGKKLLKNKFIVDVSKKNLSFDHKYKLKA